MRRAFRERSVREDAYSLQTDHILKSLTAHPAPTQTLRCVSPDFVLGFHDRRGQAAVATVTVLWVHRLQSPGGRNEAIARERAEPKELLSKWISCFH